MGNEVYTGALTIKDNRNRVFRCQRRELQIREKTRMNTKNLDCTGYRYELKVLIFYIPGMPKHTSGHSDKHCSSSSSL